MKQLLLFLALTLALLVSALDGVSINPDGSLTVGGITGRLQAFDAAWKVRSQTAEYLTSQCTGERLAGVWRATAGASFNLVEEAHEEDGKLFVDFKLAAEGEIPLKLLCFTFALPDAMAGKTVWIDGKPHLLPVEGGKGMLSSGAAKSVAFEAGGKLAVVTGRFSVELRDTRKEGKGNYQLRLRLAPEGKALREAALSLTLDYPGTLPKAAGGFTWKDDAEYRPLPERDSVSVAPGSALDFSFLQDAPAGKHGRVVVRDGHFEFADRPGVPARFYGANLCFDAQFLPKEECERLVADLSRIGYNAVRLHHYDAMLVKDMPDTVTLNPEQLDRLDYLVFCLKKAGIYIATDFYCNRVTKAEEIPELAGAPGRRPMKKAVLLFDSARNNWKAFVGNLLNHVNTYTGVRWGDEPALAMASLLNEDPAFHIWDRDPVLKAAFERDFEAWSSERQLRFKGDDERRYAMAQFLIERQIEVYREFRRFVHEDLRCPLVVSGVNFKNAEAQSFIRETLDYVDNHSYFNHPAFPEGVSYHMPVKFKPGNPISGGAPAIDDLSNSRIYGKPFTITETNFVSPNPFRAISGAVLGTYGGLQDYDAFFRFAYSHRAKDLFKPRTMQYYDIVSDPVNLLSERIGLMLFLRRDVKPFQKRRVWVYDESAYRAFQDFGGEGGRFPGSFGRLAITGQLGCINRENVAKFDKKNTEFFVSKRAKELAGATVWEGELAKKMLSGTKQVSDTGEFTLVPGKKQFQVVTPRSEVALLSAGTELAGSFMTVRNQRSYGVFFITSLDHRPLVESRRMLLLHLTDVQNSGIRFDDESCSMLRNWGTMPLRFRHGVAEVSLKLSPLVRISALGLDGLPLREVKGKPSNGGVTLTLDNADGGVMAYEITR